MQLKQRVPGLAINDVDLICISGTRVFVARVARQTKTREYKDLDAHLTANLGYRYVQDESFIYFVN